MHGRVVTAWVGLADLVLKTLVMLRNSDLRV